MVNIFLILGLCCAFIAASVPSDYSGALVPENGSTLDLRKAVNRFIKVALTHALGADADVTFDVVPPENHGIVVVIRSMTLRQGVPVIGPSRCYEYVQFDSTDSTTGKRHVAFACGSITEDSFELVGHRSFVTGINQKVTVKVRFTNEFVRQNSNSSQQTSTQSDANSNQQTSNENGANSNSTFVLDIVAYSDCSRKKSLEEFACSPTMCIPWALHCDSNYNCPVDDQSTPQDELDCQFQKRETHPPGQSETSAPPQSSTAKPSRFDVSSSYWPWNWGSKRKSTTTTTESPNRGTLVVTVVDHSHDTTPGGPQYDSWWDNQMPFITVILVFLLVSCLLFGMCSYLAKWSTRQHLTAQLDDPEPPSPRRQDPLGVPNHYSIPAPEGRIYFYPECDNRAYCPTPPPPPYQPDHGVEPPPSYNTLFHKSPSSLYASDAGGTPVAHAISVPPVYDPAAIRK